MPTEKSARSINTSGVWQVAFILALVAFILVMGWTQRWTSDDGFIFVRVVHQILAGNGPVFNAGERVEAATSPLWVLLLTLGQLTFSSLATEWIAVILGLTCTAAAVAIVAVAAARAIGSRRVMPLGLIAYVALLPAAQYVTAGLEMGLSLLWIATSFLGITNVRPANRRWLLLTGACIGLGPLVRPDLMLMTLVFLVALVILAWPLSLRRLAQLALATAALPVTYELFRMAYYGNLLPNTAYTKEASAANWQQGWWYLTDFALPYALWIPALIIAISVAAVLWEASGRRRIVLLTPVVAGLLYGLAVVRGGGDFMHGRMLLPALFALLAPVAVVPSRSRVQLALVAAVLLWAVMAFQVTGPGYEGRGPHNIQDERQHHESAAGRHNPVTVDDYAAWGLVALGRAQKKAAAHDQRRLFLFTGRRGVRAPLRPDIPYRAVYGMAAIGMSSVAAGNNVYVSDTLSLANPIGSRFTIADRSRPGHEKRVPHSWVLAQFADPKAPVPNGIPSEDVAAARLALGCPQVLRILARARDPLTFSRVARNLVEAITDFSVRISPDPQKAKHCQS
jgi:arabinofuranosyltransferase